VATSSKQGAVSTGSDLVANSSNSNMNSSIGAAVNAPGGSSNTNKSRLTSVSSFYILYILFQT
jgi:hypothetical protein